MSRTKRKRPYWLDKNVDKKTERLFTTDKRSRKSALPDPWRNGSCGWEECIGPKGKKEAKSLLSKINRKLAKQEIERQLSEGKMVEQHWTAEDPEAFMYRIKSDVMAQIEEKAMEQFSSPEEFFKRAGIDQDKDYDEFTLEDLIRLASVVGLTISILAYENSEVKTKGPVFSGLFETCWKKQGCPTTYFDLEE